MFPRRSFLLTLILLSIISVSAIKSQNPPQQASQERTIKGIVTDSQCKCNGKALEPGHGKCAVKCVNQRHDDNEKAKKDGKEPSEDIVYGVCEMAKSFYVVDPKDQELVAAYAGQEVTITGAFQGSKMTVASISPFEKQDEVIYASTKYTGYISDSQCGAKGANDKHAACAEKCVKEHGAKYVFVNDADKKVYGIADQEKVAAHAGHHVTVKGSVNGDMLKLASVDMAAWK